MHVLNTLGAAQGDVRRGGRGVRGGAQGGARGGRGEGAPAAGAGPGARGAAGHAPARRRGCYPRCAAQGAPASTLDLSTPWCRRHCGILPRGYDLQQPDAEAAALAAQLKACCLTPLHAHHDAEGFHGTHLVLISCKLHRCQGMVLACFALAGGAPVIEVVQDMVPWLPCASGAFFCTHGHNVKSSARPAIMTARAPRLFWQEAHEALYELELEALAAQRVVAASGHILVVEEAAPTPTDEVAVEEPTELELEDVQQVRALHNPFSGSTVGHAWGGPTLATATHEQHSQFTGYTVMGMVEHHVTISSQAEAQ